jgi:hypothetical protein
MKSTKTLFSLIAGYIFSLLVFRIWYFTSGTPIMEIVVVVVLVTVLYALYYFLILSFYSLQIPWKSFLLVLILTLSLPILIQIVYHEKYRLGRAEETKRAEEIQATKEAHMRRLIAKIDDANKTSAVLKDMLEIKNIENDELRRKLNKNINRKYLEEGYKTKSGAVIQANSNKDISEKKINSAAGNIDLDTKKQEIIFKVQIISSGTRLAKNSPHLKDQKNVWEYKDKGLYKYTVGNQMDLLSASVLQSEFQRKGFSGAFVVAFKNGKRIPVGEAKKLLN